MKKNKIFEGLCISIFSNNMSMAKIINISSSKFIRGLWMTIIEPFWWIWIIVLGIPVFRIFQSYFRKWLEKWFEKRWLKKHKKLMEWKTIDPRKFERIVAIIYENLGYKTKVKGGPGDRGVDIIGHKEGKRIFIQCKRKDKVSPINIREFYGSIVSHLKKGERGVFVTTGEFTQEGREFVKDKPIELINGLKLEELANQ